jgi:hypothetical protein
MHLLVLAASWWLLSLGLKQMVLYAKEHDLFEANENEQDVKLTVVLAAILTLLYFPALGMSFLYLYWGFVGILQGTLL